MIPKGMMPAPTEPGPDMIGFLPHEVFEVDGIRYVAPHVAHRMRADNVPGAPDRDTGHVVRRPMIAVYDDHLCADEGASWCGPESSGRAWRWEPYLTEHRPSP